MPEGVVVWQNADCTLECLYKGVCGYIEADSLKFRSGIGGREGLVRWIIGTPPPPPNMRVNPSASDGVELYWDNFSELVPDNKSQQIDFEGYRLWRAANWTRPIGTSISTGPPTNLWGGLVQIDLRNGLGGDTGIDQYTYEPLRSSMLEVRIGDAVTALKEHYIAYPAVDPPCPQGVDELACDTLKTIALWELGRPGGRKYYRFLGREVHEGAPYFYSVVAFDHRPFGQSLLEGLVGDPASNFVFVEPTSTSQPPQTYDSGKIYVVPNPATRESMEPWALGPTNDDPSGEKIEFRNLPATRGTVRIFTLAGDLVETLRFDGTGGNGTVKWDLISRNGQSIGSGVYLYSIETEAAGIDRVIGKFVVIR